MAPIVPGVMAAIVPGVFQSCSLCCCHCAKAVPCSCPVQFAIPRLAGFDEYFAHEESVSGGDLGLTQNTGSGSDAWRGMPTERSPY